MIMNRYFTLLLLSLSVVCASAQTAENTVKTPVDSLSTDTARIQEKMIGIGEVTEEGIKFMHDEFDFHDFDEQLKEFKKNPPKELPLFYYLHICEIISHSGLK